MMTSSLKILGALALLAALSYIIGTILPTKVVFSIISILLLGMVLYIAYLFFTKVIEPTPDNLLGAALATIVLATAPLWLLSIDLMFTLLKIVILPLIVLTILLAGPFKELIREQRFVGFVILLILGISLISLVIGVPLAAHPAVILLFTGFILAGLLLLYGAALQFFSLR